MAEDERQEAEKRDLLEKPGPRVEIICWKDTPELMRSFWVADLDRTTRFLMQKGKHVQAADGERATWSQRHGGSKGVLPHDASTRFRFVDQDKGNRLTTV